jgi:tetraacyldisaccharide 4'-kinase
MKRRLAEAIRRGDSLPPGLGLLLEKATVFQRIGMQLRMMRPKIRVPARVISFGNLTAGGTGKTPAVIARTLKETGAGKNVAVITRGYGSAKVREPLLLTPEVPAEEVFRQAGDEAALIRRRAPEAAIVKSADRAAGARLAVRKGFDTLILDDGYQAVMLDRNENILVIDATNPFGNGHLIPRGILREEISAIHRATEIVVTRCDQVDDPDLILNQIRVLCPNTPLRPARHAPAALWRLCDGATFPAGWLEKREISAVCGIGNPEAFYQTLEDCGAVLAEKWAWPDHAEIPVSKLPRKLPVITTEKDAVRMGNAPENVFALAIELEEMG